MYSITDLDSDEDGYAIDRNNVFVNSTEEITQVGSLTPPYSYTWVPPSSFFQETNLHDTEEPEC